MPLDVTDDASVTAAAALIEERARGLDVIVNNAAITGGRSQLRRSASPRIVNMSSGVGSLTRQSEPGGGAGPISVAYSPSKTFLNAVTVQYAKELRETHVLINAACPGFTATDLNGSRGVRTPQQGAAIAIHLATLPDDGATGGYVEDAGVIPW